MSSFPLNGISFQKVQRMCRITSMVQKKKWKKIDWRLIVLIPCGRNDSSGICRLMKLSELMISANCGKSTLIWRISFPPIVAWWWGIKANGSKRRKYRENISHRATALLQEILQKNQRIEEGNEMERKKKGNKPNGLEKTKRFTRKIHRSNVEDASKSRMFDRKFVFVIALREWLMIGKRTRDLDSCPQRVCYRENKIAKSLDRLEWIWNSNRDQIDWVI